MSPLEISVATEFFGIERPVPGQRWYRYTICTPDPGLVPLDGGMTLQVEQGLDALRRADTIVIPGWCGRATAPSPELIAALRAATPGRPDGVVLHRGVRPGRGGRARRATGHHSLGGGRRLRRRFPTIDLNPEVLYIQDGNMWTSAGSAASIDCALAIVREDYGADVANHVARDLVVPPHRQGGQAQFVAAPLPVENGTDSLAAAARLGHRAARPTPHGRRSGRARPSEPPPVQPRFREATGTTPHQWLLSQRILLARRLLETTDLSIDRVANEAGFGSPAALRMHFQRIVRTSPLAYRRVFTQAAS